MPPHSSGSSKNSFSTRVKLRQKHLVILVLALGLLGIGYAFSPHVRSGVASLNLAATGTRIAAGEGFGSEPRMSLAGSTAAVPLQTCTVNCSATVPASGTAGQSVSFQSTGTPSNCATSASFQWSFGDGGTSTQQNPNYTYNTPGTFNWQVTVSASQSGGGGGNTISTVAGGEGEGTQASQVSFNHLSGVARDPLGRGVYLTAENPTSNFIYFVNTSSSSATIAGKTIAAGEVRVVAGGGTLFGVENVLGVDADLSVMRGVAVSNDGNVVYFIENGVVRALNVGNVTITIGGGTLGPNNVRTLAASGFGSELAGIAVNPSDSAVFVVDATAGINRVFRIDPTTGATSTIVGNGAASGETDPFVPGQANNIPLRTPRAIEFEANGNLIVADTGHSRVIRVSPATASGNATLLGQYATGASRPFNSGLAVAGGNIYTVNGSSQTVVQVTGGAGIMAGQSFVACNYQSSPPCGDGGQAAGATFALVGPGGGGPQEAGTDGDANGIFLIDQSPFSRARLRYINRSGGTVTLAGTAVPAGTIQTIAGKGLDYPYDGGASTAAYLAGPLGVAVDANNNLWSTDSLSVNRLRFHNRGASQVTLFPGTFSEQIVPAGATVTVNRDSGGAADVIPAIQGNFANPQGIFITSQGVYVADTTGGPTNPSGFAGTKTSALRFINTSASTVVFFPNSAAPVSIPPGSMTRIAGCEPIPTTCAELGFARTSRFVGMSDVVVAPNGDIYVTVVGDSTIRKISPSTGNVTNASVPFTRITGLGISTAGLVHAVDVNGGNLLRETAAGSGTFVQFATGLSSPRDVALAADGTAYVTTAGNHRIVQVSTGGVVTAFAGTSQGFSGDGGPATSARINISPPTVNVSADPTSPNNLPQTVGIAVAASGEVFFTDTNNNRLRRIGGGGLVTCVRSGSINIGASSNPVPSVANIVPSTTLAGGAGFQITVNGSNFVNGASVVRWNGSPRTTNFVSSNILQAQVTASDIATAGVATVTVFNAAPGGGVSPVGATFTITNPVASLSGLNPSSALAGSIAFNMTVSGNNFVTTSTVQWNGSNRTTTFVNANTLTAAITAGDVINPGTANVTVVNPAPGGGTSNTLTFTIATAGQGFEGDVAPRPTGNGTVSLQDYVQVGRFAAQLDTVNVGSEFQKADCAPSATLGNGSVSLADWVQTGRYAAFLDTPVPAAGGPTGPPPFAPPGEDTPTTNLVAVPQQNGAISALAATIQRGQTGTVFIQFITTGAQGGISFSVNFEPTQLTYVKRTVVEITGTGLAAGSTVIVNDSDTNLALGRIGFLIAAPTGAAFPTGTLQILNLRFTALQSGPNPTTPVGFGQMPVQFECTNAAGAILPNPTFTPGTVTITAANNPVPTVTTLNPTSVLAGSGQLTLTVNGTNFVNGAVVRFAGNDRVTSFVNSTQLTATILAGDVQNAGTPTVAVFNAAPGGGLSNIVNFTVTATNPVPTISNLNPNTATAGSGAFNLIVTGTSFVSNSVVNFGGIARVTTFNGPSQLTAAILASDVQNVGSPLVTVTSPGPGGGTSNSLTFTITATNPVPTLTNLNPNTILAGSGNFNLIVTGTNFVAASVVSFGGNPRATTFNGPTQLTAQILASDVQNSGTPSVTVNTPAPGGGTSNSLTFTITNNPVPTITNTNPTSATAGGLGFVLTVNGTNFIPSSTVRWNGGSRITTFVNATQLTAQITVADISVATTAAVTVFNGAPGGGISNSVNFAVILAATSVVRANPTSIQRGQNGVVTIDLVSTGLENAAGFTMGFDTSQVSFVSAAAGSGTAGATVNINAALVGSGLLIVNVAQSPGTTFAAGTRQLLTVTFNAVLAGALPTSMITFPGAPAPNEVLGVTANTLPATFTPGTVTFTQGNNPVPTVASLSPNSVVAGSAAFLLTVTGTNFVGPSVVRWNGGDRITGFLSPTQLTAQITLADVANQGSASITVFNLLPGGGLSNALTFNITATNPIPTVTSLTPNSTAAGSAAFSLSVNGGNFLVNSVVQWNGVARTTTFSSSTLLMAAIPASDVLTQGTAQVTVLTPSPGGGTSNALTFTISAAQNPGPIVTSLSPTSTTAGGPQFTLLVNGSNFVNGAVVIWNGNPRATTFVNAGQLSVTIPATDIATAGTANIVVTNPAPGGGTSGPLVFTINNLVPAITSLTPPSAVAGGAAFQLGVNGSNFTPTSVVQWNGANRATAFVSSILITAAIGESDIAAQGSANVTVFNPTPGGGTSNSLVFTVTSATSLPVISSLAPNSALAGGAQFALRVLGSNFMSSSKVLWNGAQRTTTFDNSGQLTAIITASDIAQGGTVTVTVNTAGVNGGTSNPATFNVSGPNPIPTLSSINPSSIAAGSPGFTLNVTGTGFVSGAIVKWNGADRPTTFVNSTTVTAQIPAGDVSAQGSALVSVINPAPGGGISNDLVFTITPGNPVPTLTSLNPSQVASGSGALTLTVSGTNFVNGAVISWNGSARATTFLNSTTLTAQINANDVLNGGTSAVTVFNPVPGGGTSNALTFTIVGPNPVPVIGSLNPPAALVGGQAFVLAVSGTGFVPASVVNWNGSPRITTFVGPTQLTAQISAADIAAVTTASVTVFNTAPGGGTSNAVSFSVGNPNPVPTLSQIDPATTAARGGQFTLTVTGTNFFPGSVVQWNGGARPTVYVNATTLTALIPATDIVFTGTASVTVFNGLPGGGTSSALSFAIINPVPAITMLNPVTVLFGSPAFTLQVTGINFVDNSVVRFNGQDRATQFINATQLNVQITAADVAAVGTATITVFTPGPGGGSSNAVNFFIVPPSEAPILTQLSPPYANVGGPQFELTAIGSRFALNSVIQWNGAARETTFISPTMLRALIPASDISFAGSASIRVFTPQPGGGLSLALRFTIARPLANANAASFIAGIVAPQSLVAAFGEDLATGTANATMSPLPLTLLGTGVVVRDSLGVNRPAGLISVSPGQVNYEMPSGTAFGTATVTIVSGDSVTSIGQVQVVAVAPGIFAANAGGQGPASAEVVRGLPGGGQITQSTVRFDAVSGQFVPVPIVFGPQTETLFVVFYGTGFRGRTSLSGVTATLGGTPLTVAFAGAAPGFVGLDQLNLGPVPRSFIGRGTVNLVLMVDGKVANTVTLTFQ